MRSGSRQIDVRLVEAVGSVDEQDVAGTGHRATAHVVLGHAHLAHHVVGPNDVPFIRVFVRFAFERSVVLAVEKSFHIQAEDFTPAGHEPEPVSIHKGSTANPLQGPVVHAAGRELVAGMLPQKLARFSRQNRPGNRDRRRPDTGIR